MKNLLIPIDRSDYSWQMASCILWLHQQPGTHFYLLDKTAVAADHKGALREHKQFKQLEVSLQEGQKIIGLETKGDFIKNVQEAIAAYEIDLIILGNRRPNGDLGLSVTQHNKDLITRVKCPVFLFPEKFKCRLTKQMVLLTDYQFTHRSKATSILLKFAQEAEAHLNILQLSKKSSRLSAGQMINKSYLENALEPVNHSYHFVVNDAIDEALQFFINAHGVDLVVVFARHIHLCERLIFRPTHNSGINYHEHTCFMIIHE